MQFSDVQIGTSIGPEPIVVSKEQARQYSRDCGFAAPRFMDDEGAKKEGLPGMILPGNMSLAILTRLVTDWIGASGARLIRIGTTYRVPVQPDKNLSLQGFVTNMYPDTRQIEIDVWIENEEAERLVTGTATVEFPN